MARKKLTKNKYTAAEIVDLVTRKRDSTALTELWDQMEEDFDLFRGKEYEAETGHKSFTSPKPKNDFNKIFSALNKSSLTWNIVVPEDASTKDRESATKGEAILTGVLDRVDRQLRKVGEPPLRQAAGSWACMRGALGGKCLIYGNEDKETVIDMRSVDPLQMRWERGAEGLVWGAHEYPISKAEAKDRYGVELSGEGDTGRVIDFFDTEINAVVLVSGSIAGVEQEFVKKPEAHGLDHVPMFIGFSGGLPTIYNKENELQLQYRANSVYASSRTLYPVFNEQVSFIMDMAEKSVAGTLVHRSLDGKKTMKGDPFANWQVINVEKDETIEPLEAPKVPAETGMILSILDRDLQQSTVPFPLGYGLDPSGTHSGTALSMLNDNMRSIYDPFSSLLEDFYHWGCEEILEQFKQKGQKLNLKGFDTKGKFFALDADPDDIQDDWYIQVKCEPRLPRDEAGELQMAMMATQERPGGEPLVSYLTAREKFIKLQNPEAEVKRIEDERIQRMINQTPQIQLRKMAQSLLDSGDRMGALEFLNAIPAPPGAQGGQPPMGGSPPMGMPPPGMGGVPPMMPGGVPPMMGGQPPVISPEDIAIAQGIAQKMMQEGRPIPPELQAVLAMGQGG